jgi:aryl carrier-like protein
VLVREDVPGHQQLVAYVVGKEPESSALGSQLLVLGSELRTFLRERLPEYMVPAVFVPLAALPLTTTGKLNRRALPAPELSRPELAATYVAPRTPAETTLAAIWADVLGLERVGVADSFFELGGDSILSIRVVAQANAQGLPLTMKQMVQHPTIAALADELAVAPSPAIDQAPVSGDVALTPIQRWFFERWSTTPERYTQLMLLRSRESLDPAALRQVIQDLVQRHDALRLRYERTATGWRQYNAASEEHTLFVEIDLSHVAEAEQRAALEATAGQLQARIDLADGPLVQLALIDLGPDTPQHLLLVIHHLAVDNVSWQILLDDLQTLYQQLKHGLPAQLPPKTTSFQEWAALLTAYAQTDAARDELDYWLRLPVERSRPLPVDQPAIARLPQPHRSRSS